MKLTIQPGQRLNGTVPLPGDKSISHRAALFAALATGTSRIEGFLSSGVTTVLLNALRSLGIDWQLVGTVLTVQGVGLNGLTASHNSLYCGNSATTMRLLAGALAAAGTPAVLDGSASLSARPMERITTPLQQLGVPISTSSTGTAPLTLLKRPASQPLSGAEIVLPVASAQVKSAVLLAALASDAPVTVIEPAASRDHTERMLSAMGVSIETTQQAQAPSITLFPDAGKNLSPLQMKIPGDFSAAAFLIVAALVTPSSHLHLTNVGLNPTRIGLLHSLQEMGGKIEISNQHRMSGEPVGDLSIHHSELHGVMVNGDRVVQMIDEFPIFAVAAAAAHGVTVVKDAQELRHKESDRIAAIANNLQQCGVTVQEQQDGFTIEGTGSVRGGAVIDPHHDHRTAMSLAVLGLASQQPVTVLHVEIINESFPNFIAVLQSLGGDLTVTEDE